MKGKSRNFIILLIAVFAVVSLSSCTGLRKKFTRKKKKKVEDTFIPVLVPEDYVAKANDPMVGYGHFYTLWGVWYKDMQAAIDYKESRRRKLYIAGEMLKALQSMHNILPLNHKVDMAELVSKMQRIVSYIDQPEHMWQASVLEKRLRVLEKDVRNKYKTSVAQTYFDEQ